MMRRGVVRRINEIDPALRQAYQPVSPAVVRQLMKVAGRWIGVKR